MIARYRNGRVAKQIGHEESQKHRNNLNAALLEYREAMGQPGPHSTGQARIDDALRYIGVISKYCDGLIETKAPWKLAKDHSEGERLDAVLYSLVESLS